MVIENLVQLVGWLAVFRGLVILKRVGGGTTRESSDTPSCTSSVERWRPMWWVAPSPWGIPSG
jgi:hypothetical protein